MFSFLSGNSSKSRNKLGWKQSGEQEAWAGKAIDVLVKKLKKNKDSIKHLEHALESRSPQSECVTIPRSMDGRLQVANCKALPHVIYCRVWRWPDLQSHHELKAVKTCRYAFQRKEQNVCINPYHYTRVEAAVPPPIVVPLKNEFAPGFSLLHSQQSEQSPAIQQYQMPTNMVVPPNGFNAGSCSSAQSSPVSSVSSSSYGYPQQTNQMDQFNMETPPIPTNDGQQANTVHVHYEEPAFWASIAYYELNTRVGEAFKCRTNIYSVTVDGFTNPYSENTDRFCLGQLSNVNRNSTIESTRRHIGKGARLFFEGNDLYIECLSDAAIFVQSRMCNYLHNFDASNVLKLQTGQTLRLFNICDFNNLLNQAVQHGFEAAYELVKMCTTRISFVKGWGSHYQRLDVTSTPCWIELHLHGPFQLLDKVLQKMGSPLYAISSVS